MQANFYWAIKDEQWGILNSRRQVIVPAKYDFPYIEPVFYDEVEAVNPVIMVRDDSIAELIDLGRGIISPSGATYIKRHEWGYTFRLSNGHFGVIDSAGKIKLPAISDIEPYKFSDTSFLLKVDSTYLLYSQDWKIIDDLKVTEDQILINLLSNNAIHGIELDSSNFNQDIILAGMNYFLRHFDLPDDEMIWDSPLSEADDIPSLVKEALITEPYLDFGKVSRGLRCLHILEYSDDADCHYPGEATTESLRYGIKVVNPYILEITSHYRTGNDFHVWEEFTSYHYFRFKNGTFDSISLSTILRNADSALVKWKPLLRDAFIKEVGEEPEFDMPKIGAIGSFKLDVMGLWLAIPVENGQTQIFFNIPADEFKKHISREGLELGIRPFRKD